MNATKQKKIAIFGHYGNQNLGDEAITESAINCVKNKLPDATICCMSINPLDSTKRHGLEAFPIRYRKDFFQPSANKNQPENQGASVTHPTESNSQHKTKSFKDLLKSIPILGFLLKLLIVIKDNARLLIQELIFLSKGKAFLKDVDLIMVTGSNQFLDNFGGPWGFPYTLLKWTILAKLTNTKIAFLSIGAGPLTQPLSYKFLAATLKRADYISYRDNGSKDLIESKIPINAPVYPDIAHSLGNTALANNKSGNTGLVVSVNVMPIYDARYWYQADDDKYRDYVRKITDLCETALNDGHSLVLFSTQKADENVIDDVLTTLTETQPKEIINSRVKSAKHASVRELINTLSTSDIVVATRFHATVLPMQLGKPTLGICYYRKAEELLCEFGLSDFYVSIDSFDSKMLIDKFRKLVASRDEYISKILAHHGNYAEQLDEQYDAVLGLMN